MPKKKKKFCATVLCLTDEGDRRTYEEIMQSITDKDGTYELAADPKSNWDKVGNYHVALEYFHSE